jgi:uncharacterized protein YprB with RNaseH-like and TPR domain
MDAAKLSDRLRAIVRKPLSAPPDTREQLSEPESESLLVQPAGFHTPEAELGGEWQRRDGVSCFVVERRESPDAAYGREALKSIAARLAEASAESALVMGGMPGSLPFLFFDLETTGLNGGAGTYAFLVGCGMFDDEGGFVTRQFVLLRHVDERQLLQGVGAEFSKAGALVSFNGKSFDAPLIETRHLYHRLEWRAGGLPHLDVLHPARRFWGQEGPGVAGDGSCSLGTLERSVLGARRRGDVPGFEIPARYFQFVRSGDARPLAGVLEHNRLDLLSLAGLTARLLDLIRRGPTAARRAREALALGRLYARCGLESRAHEAYECAIAMTQRGASMVHAGTSMVPIKIEALRSLAYLSRRARRFDEAADYWRRLLEIPGCPPQVIREATEALAIHHEHRARDLPAAKAFALRSLIASVEAEAPRSRARDLAARHRLARIERKMDRSRGLPLAFEPVPRAT